MRAGGASIRYWPGDDVVDWTGVNVFQEGRGKKFSSMPNSTCVMGFANESARRGFPVLLAETLPRFFPTTGGAESWSGWFEPFFAQLLAHQAVSGWSYIDRDCRSGGSRTQCVGGLWGDGRIEPKNASYVGGRYQKAISDDQFVHASSLAATCTALGVPGCS